MRKFLAILLLTASAGCTTRQAVPNPTPSPLGAIEALRPYYASLSDPLPAAPPAAALDTKRTLTRIAFGSCAHQERSQDFWSRIAARRPDLFLMIGDNVYGDTRSNGAANLPSLRAAYARLAGRDEFRKFRGEVPMLATWDDHDLGMNDAGGSFDFKEYAERIFETFWDSAEDVRRRPGVYQEMIAGPAGQRVQILLLDTRFFRSDLRALPYQVETPPRGWYVADDDAEATLLGDEQWRWLEQALDRPAELRLIVSSIQIVTDAHGYEKWGNFPKERQRLYRLLAAKKISNALLLSGDRHAGALYRSPDFPNLYEITSSSLNLSLAKPGETVKEPDPSRIGDLYPAENFGLVDIDWAKGVVTVSLVSNPFVLTQRRIDGLVLPRK